MIGDEICGFLRCTCSLLLTNILSIHVKWQSGFLCVAVDITGVNALQNMLSSNVFVWQLWENKLRLKSPIRIISSPGLKLERSSDNFSWKLFGLSLGGLYIAPIIVGFDSDGLLTSMKKDSISSQHVDSSSII